MSGGRGIDSFDCDGVNVCVNGFYATYQGVKDEHIIGIVIIDDVR